MDVDGAVAADGTNVHIWTDTGVEAQKWQVIQNADGTYKLRNPVTNRMLDVDGGASADGTNVHVWSDNGSGAQKWQLTQNADGTYAVVNPQSGKALDVSGAGTTNGTNVHIWSVNGAAAQKWQLIALESPPPPATNITSGSTYRLVNPGSGKALDVNGGVAVDGTDVHLWTVNSSGAQEWRITQNADGTYELLNPATNRALDVEGAGTADGTNVHIWTKNNSVAQKWSITQNVDGTYKVVNPNSSKALDIQNGGTADGTDINIWTDNGGAAQKWQLVSLSPATAAPVVQSHSSGSASSTLTLTKPAGTTNGDLLILTMSADLEANENVSYTIPSGWTSLLPLTRSDASSAGSSLQVWYKTANNEPADYAIAPDHANLIGGSIARITGHAAASPIDTSAVAPSASGEALAPSVTTTINNTLVLSLVTWDQSKTLTAAPAGLTQLYHVDVNGLDNWGGHKAQASAGGAGVAQFDLSSGAPYVGFTVAVRPAGSPPAPPPAVTFTGSGAASPATLSAGDTVTLNASFVNTSAASTTARILLQVRNPSDQEVYSKDFPNETFAPGQSKSYSTTWTVPQGGQTGTYVVKGGAGNNDLTVWHLWSDSLGTFSVTTAPPPPSGTPVVRAQTSGSTSDGALTLAKPTGTVNGDLLVLAANADLEAGENVTYTVASGWTSLLPSTRSDPSAAGANLQVWYKIADSEPANYTVTPDHANLIGGSIMRIDGHNAASPVDVSAVTASPAGEANAPTVTTRDGNELVLRLFAWVQSKTINSAPSGVTQAYHVDVSGLDNWGGYKEQAAAGSTGVAQFDLSGGAPYVGYTLAIRPQGSASTAPLHTTELLPAAWNLTGNNGASEKYQTIVPNELAGKTTVRISYNLHGLSALGGDASAVIYDQNGWKYVSLSSYGQNGLNGSQTVDIPLSAFGLNLSQPVGTLHTRFWYSGPFTVDITSIQAF